VSRNIEGYPFGISMTTDQRNEIVAKIEKFFENEIKTGEATLDRLENVSKQRKRQLESEQLLFR
jgi:protein-arginine kinase